MDEVLSLIEEFREENTEALEDEDSSRKDQIVMDLQDLDSTDPRVLPFFLEVLGDENEFDLARIEILKFLELREHRDNAQDEQTGQLVKRILGADPDDDVRNYAALAAGNYLAVSGVVDELERILFNENEDRNLRWNAFAAMKRMGPANESIKIMKKLAKADEFRESASALLSKWSTTSP